MLLVDGHNLAFADDEARKMLIGSDPEGSRKRIVELVEIYARSIRQQAIIVFDGSGGREPKGGTDRVQYFFSGPDRPADLDLMRIIRGSTGRRELTLVSSDRSLTADARKHRVTTIGSATFLKEVAALQRRRRKPIASEPVAKLTGGTPPSEVEYWLKVFGELTADDIEEGPPSGPKRKSQ
jgi:predicted RNA-binding protein with PIN domain